MTKKTGLLALAAVLGALSSASAADLTGKVTLKGTPAPEKALPIDLKDGTCGKMHKEVPKTRFYVTGADGGLAEVMIVVRSGPGIDGKTFEPPAEPAVLDQVGCEYTPYVMGIQAKQKLLVKNSDPFMHNVNVQPAAAGNKGSNKAQMANAKPFEYVFENPETFLRYKCDVHPWMFSYVTVVPHPYFAVTDKDGNFTIKNLPPGKYVVEAIHRKTHPNGKGVTQEVTVEAGAARPVEFRLEAPTE